MGTSVQWSTVATSFPEKRNKVFKIVICGFKDSFRAMKIPIFSISWPFRCQNLGQVRVIGEL